MLNDKSFSVCGPLSTWLKIKSFYLVDYLNDHPCALMQADAQEQEKKALKN